MILNRLSLLFFISALALSSCTNNTAPAAYTDFESELQFNINNAREGDVIELPEGKFHLTKPLEIKHAKNLTIRGKGHDKTYLDFDSKQDSTGCLKISADGATLENFTIYNISSNAIVIRKARGVTIRDLEIKFDSLSTNPNTSGICINECKNTLIQGCDIINATNAGLSMTSSTNTIIRQNNFHNNTTGIENENCTNVDIYDNTVAHNAIGMVIARTPAAVKKNSGYRILNNHIQNNNLEKRQVAENLAGEIPTGTGLAIIAINTADIAGNEISGQKTTCIAVLSYFKFSKTEESGAPVYCSGIGVHDNRISPDTAKYEHPTGLLGKIFTDVFGKKIPDLIYDGYFNPAYLNADGSMKDEQKMCFRNNSGCSFGDMDLPGKGAHRSNNSFKYECTRAPMIEVKLN